MATQFPSDFDPTSYESIPYGSMNVLFEGESREVELAGREKIRVSLENRLKTKVVGRDQLTDRFGLRRLGYTHEDIMMNRVVVR
jgi:hypothetical protein